MLRFEGATCSKKLGEGCLGLTLTLWAPVVPASVALALGVVPAGSLVALERHLHVSGVWLNLALVVLLPSVRVRLRLLGRLHRKDIETAGMGHLGVIRVHPLGSCAADQSALPPALQRWSGEAGAAGQVGQGGQHQEARSGL